MIFRGSDTRVRCRRPNLGDLMILIVASAVGLAYTQERIKAGSAPLPSAPPIVQLGDWLFVWFTPWLSMTSVAALAIRLKRPRLNLARLHRQPGMIASLIVTSYLLFLSPFFIVGMIGRPRLIDWITYTFGGKVIQAGGMIAAVWTILAISRRLRREPGWIDSLGVQIGSWWIGVWLITSMPSLIYR